MDKFSKSPGLVHIMERIFSNLNQENHIKCKNVNDNWKKIVENVEPNKILFKKCVNQGLLSPIQQEKWTKVIQTLLDSKLSIHLNRYLAQIHSGKWPEKYRTPFFLLPLYIVLHPRVNKTLLE